jgi:hypothetical protein
MSFNEGTLDRIRTNWLDLFEEFKTFANKAVARARFEVEISKPRIYDVCYAWNDDIYRVCDREPHLKEGLDHFKTAGHLALWLRRFTPVIELKDLSWVDAHEPWDERDREFKEFLKSYHNEFLAFEFGLELVRFYEKMREDGPGPRWDMAPTLSFYKTTAHFMKFKTVSPHAMNLAYKALFNE